MAMGSAASQSYPKRSLPASVAEEEALPFSVPMPTKRVDRSIVSTTEDLDSVQPMAAPADLDDEPTTASLGDCEEYSRVQPASGSLDKIKRRSVRSLIIFDWDDTLLPTTWLSGQGLLASLPCSFLPCGQLPLQTHTSFRARLSSAVRSQLRQVEAAAQRLLEAAWEASDEVAIVTNGSPSWVEDSAAVFLPRLLPLLGRSRILARPRAEASDFKRRTFAKLYTELAPKRLVSIGDGVDERAASKALAAEVGGLIQSVQLAARPALPCLLAEISSMAACLPAVMQQTSNLDGYLSVTPAADSGRYNYTVTRLE